MDECCSACWLHILGMYPIMTTPVPIGGVMDGAQTTSEQAGWIGTISVGAVAAASMLLPGLLHCAPEPKERIVDVV